MRRLLADPEVLEVLQMMKLSGHDDTQTQGSEKVELYYSVSDREAVHCDEHVCISVHTGWAKK